MNAFDSATLTSIALFAGGYLLRAWDKRGDQQSNSSVAIAELRTELASLRREVERLIDQFASRYASRDDQDFGRRPRG